MSVDEKTDIDHKKQARFWFFDAVLEKRCRVSEAAQLIGVNERHIWRLLSAYREEDTAALTHGNRNRLPANATSPKVYRFQLKIF